MSTKKPDPLSAESIGPETRAKLESLVEQYKAGKIKFLSPEEAIRRLTEVEKSASKDIADMKKRFPELK